MNNSSLFSADVEAFNRVIKSTGSNVSLKVGVVISSFDIEDEENTTKSVKEYNVLVGEQDGNAPVTPHIYRNCRQLELFGNKADFFEYTYRKNQKEFEGPTPEEEGSLVLLLCINGNSTDALIIGSIRHPGRKTNLTKESGHHLEGEFNGVNWKVDKDGALTITYKSATDNKGVPQDEKAGGTFININKEGSVDINDGDDKNYIRMDKPNGNAGVLADNNIGLTTTNKNIGLNAGESINLNAQKDLIAAAEGKAAFTVKSSFDVEAEGPASVKAQSLNVESKSMIQMKAQSMYQLEAGSNAIIRAPQLLLGPSPAQPALLAYDLVTLGIGNLGGPVISNVIAGFSASVIISS